MNSPLVQYQKKLQNDDFEVIFEVLPLYDFEESDSRKREIKESIASIEKEQLILENRIKELNCDIERLTNHADGIDYSIAVGCGVLCGIIDSLYVGEFDYEEALAKSKEKVNDYVTKKAEKIRKEETVKKAIENAKKKAAAKGKKLSKEEIKAIKEKVIAGIENKFKKVVELDEKDGTVNALRRSITKLESVFILPSDHAHVGIKGMNSASHHLADMAHHPTPLGLVAAIIGEVFRTGILVDKDGKWHLVWLGLDEDAKKRLLNLIIPIVISGIITWLLNIANSKYKDEIDKNLPKPIAKIVHLLAKAPLAIAILNSIRNVFSNWWGHLASDMAGSKSTPGEGMGIPGLFVSILKEISSIPPLNYTGLPKVIDDVFVKYRFDMRAELAVVNELGRQSVPIILGDVLIRTFYFVRHLIKELSEKKSYKEIDWESVIPFNNRTIVRMMTIETGTFTACDLADAAIRSTLKNGGNFENPKLWIDFALRVNFVGIGRFAIAIYSDVKMGVDRSSRIKERLFLQNKCLMLENAKIFNIQEKTWIGAEEATIAMQQLYEVTCMAFVLYNDKINKLDHEWQTLSNHVEVIKDTDPEFAGELIELLDF